MNKNKILLSTDIGSDIDDALALRIMLEEPSIKLHGIYVVNGDVTSRAMLARHMTALCGSRLYRGLDRIEKHPGLNLSYKNKLKLADIRARLLSRAGKDITVAIGDANPLYSSALPYAFFEDGLVDGAFVHESKSGEDRKMRELCDLNIKRNAVEDMAEKLSNNQYTILSIAPMTIIARLLHEHPKASRNIEKIILMGSRFSDEEPAPEHNFRFDSGAAKRVLDSDIPLLIVPGDLCARYRMPVQPLDYRLRGGSVKNYVNRMLTSFVGEKTAVNLGRNRGAVLGDHFFGRDLFEWFEMITSFVMPDREYNIAVNMDDPHEAAMSPEEYSANYNLMLKLAKDCPDKIIKGDVRKELVKQLALAIPSKISIADVYVPYIFLYPDRIKTEMRKFDCDLEGRTVLGIGNKHEVVADLDFQHFDKFVRNYYPQCYQ